MRRLFFVQFLCLSFSLTAKADLPPPKDYVEDCTVKKQQKTGETCISCGDSYFDDIDACQKQYQPKGYAKRCQTMGASVWKEVWCKPTPVVAIPKKDVSSKEKSSGIDTKEKEEKKKDDKRASEKKYLEKKSTQPEQAGCQYIQVSTSFSLFALILGVLFKRRRANG